ncbi:hypothetical protein ACWC2T_45060 [Streptomyces sp. NPDC001393]
MHVAALEWLTFGLAGAVAAAQERGLTFHLLTADRSEYTFELDRCTPGSLVVHDTDTSDAARVVKELRAIDGLAGLISTTDVCSLVAPRVAAELGLPAQPAEAGRLVRDKAALRRHLHDAGLSRAAQRTVDPFDTDAEDLASTLSYPVILKDVSGTGSRACGWRTDRRTSRPCSTPPGPPRCAVAC